MTSTNNPSFENSKSSPRTRTPGEGSSKQGAVEHLAAGAKETLADATNTVSRTAQRAYDEGSRYVRETLDEYPEAQRYYREGTEAVRHQAAENPLLTFLLGIGVGYAAAWMLHAVEWGSTKKVPEYARTRHNYGREMRES